jgi:D-alanyl-D-alanine carboxypeptidase
VNNRDSLAEWAPLISADVTRVWTPQEVIAEIADEPLLFEPGTGYHYSNANYIIAGLVIEAVTGEPLADEVTRRFTGPLSLGGTYLHSGTGGLDPRIPSCLYDVSTLDPETAATGISAVPADLIVGDRFIDACAVPLNSLTSVMGASAAMVSTPRDLLAWLPALYEDPNLLSTEAREQMVADQLGTFWMCPCLQDGPTLGLGHQGLFAGFTTQVAYYPDFDLGVVLYANQSPWPPGAFEWALVDALRSVFPAG